MITSLTPCDALLRKTFACTVIVACALTVCLVMAGVTTAGHLEDRIVAVVNSDLIMMSDVKQELEPERQRIARHHRGDELAQRLKTVEYMALTKMIERRLQLQEAKARGVDVSDQEVKQAIEQMKRQGEKLDASDPVTLRNVRDQLTLLKVVDREVRSGVMVGDATSACYDEIISGVLDSQAVSRLRTLPVPSGRH